MTRKFRHKALSITSTLLITAFTTTVAVYAGIHVNASAPGSFLAQVVPVGASTMQQMLLMAWSEFSEHLKKTCTA